MIPAWVTQLLGAIVGPLFSAISQLIGRKSAEEDRSARVAAEKQVDAIREAHKFEKSVSANTNSVPTPTREDWNAGR